MPLLAPLPAPALPASFLGPTELERRRGRPYRARLGFNECLFGTSPAALAVLRAHSARVTFYCDPTHRRLRHAVAERWCLPPEAFVVAGGIEGLLELFVRAFVGPGEVAVTSRGAFMGFDYFVQRRGGKLVHAPYARAGYNDLEALLAAAHREGAKLLFLANPDNPTGTHLPPAAIRHLLDHVPADCLLLLDEAYAEFVPDDELLPTTETRTNLVRLRSFSKAYGLAGARIGYACADPAIVASLDDVRTRFAVNALAEEAAIAALGDRAFLAGVVARTEAGRAHYAAVAAACAVETRPSAANFVAFDLGTAARAQAVAGWLEEHDVLVMRPVAPPLDRLLRVTVGPPEARAYFEEVLVSAPAVALP